MASLGPSRSAADAQSESSSATSLSPPMSRREAPSEAAEPETMKFAQGFDLTGLGSEDAGDKLIYAVKSDPNFGKTKKIDLGTLKIDGKVTKEQLRSIVKVVSIDTGVPIRRIKVSVEGNYKVEAPAMAVASADDAPETATVTEPDRVAGSGERAEKNSGPVKVAKSVRISEGDAQHVASKLIINIKKQARADGIETLTGAKARVEGRSQMTKAEFAEVKKLVAEGLRIDESKVKIYSDGVAFRREAPAETATAEVRDAETRGEKAEKRSGPVNVAETVDIEGKDKGLAVSKLVLKIKKQAIRDKNGEITSAGVRVKGSPDMTEKEWNEVRGLVAEGLGIKASEVDIDRVNVKFKPEVKREAVAKKDEGDEFLRDGQVAKKERKVTSEADFKEKTMRAGLMARTEGKAKVGEASKGVIQAITSLKPVGGLKEQGDRVGQMYRTPKGQEIFAIYGSDGKILGVKVVGSKTNEKHLGSVPENLKEFIPETIDVPKEDIFAYREKEVLSVTTKPLAEKDGVRLLTEKKELHEKRLFSKIRGRVVEALAEFKRTHGKDAVLGEIDLGQIVITNLGKDDMRSLAELQWAIHNELKADRDLFGGRPMRIYSDFVLKGADGTVKDQSVRGRIEVGPGSTASLDAAGVESEDAVNFNGASDAAAQPSGAKVQSAPEEKSPGNATVEKYVGVFGMLKDMNLAGSGTTDVVVNPSGGTADALRQRKGDAGEMKSAKIDTFSVASPGVIKVSALKEKTPLATSSMVASDADVVREVDEAVARLKAAKTDQDKKRALAGFKNPLLKNHHGDGKVDFKRMRLLEYAMRMWEKVVMTSGDGKKVVGADAVKEELGKAGDGWNGKLVLRLDITKEIKERLKNGGSQPVPVSMTFGMTPEADGMAGQFKFEIAGFTTMDEGMARAMFDISSDDGGADISRTSRTLRY